MRKATVLYKEEPAAELHQLDDGTFVFRYLDTWFNDERKPAISLTLPKKQQEYKSASLFAFFFNMLPDYRNHFVKIESRENLVIIVGFSTCSHKSLEGPALWTAKIENDRVAEWRIYDDTEENRNFLKI